MRKLDPKVEEGGRGNPFAGKFCQYWRRALHYLDLCQSIPIQNRIQLWEWRAPKLAGNCAVKPNRGVCTVLLVRIMQREKDVLEAIHYSSVPPKWFGKEGFFSISNMEWILVPKQHTTQFLRIGFSNPALVLETFGWQCSRTHWNGNGAISKTISVKLKRSWNAEKKAESVIFYISPHLLSPVHVFFECAPPL